jgi:hypothetical protein
MKSKRLVVSGRARVGVGVDGEGAGEAETVGGNGAVRAAARGETEDRGGGTEHHYAKKIHSTKSNLLKQMDEKQQRQQLMRDQKQRDEEQLRREKDEYQKKIEAEKAKGRALVPHHFIMASSTNCASNAHIELCNQQQ